MFSSTSTFEQTCQTCQSVKKSKVLKQFFQRHGVFETNLTIFFDRLTFKTYCKVVTINARYILGNNIFHKISQ